MKWLPIVSFVLLPLIAACDSQREVDSEELIFAQSQGLPEIQDVQAQLDIPQHDVTIFRVTYGADRSNACLDQPDGGCYSDAFGLHYQDKIGWLKVLDRWGDLEDDSLQYYALEPTDSYLYGTAFFERFEEANQLLYQHTFLPMLVKDARTPREVLLRISQGLRDYINPSLGMLLMQNTVARDDQVILQELTERPAFQGNPYEEVRDLAAARLAAISNN